MEQNNIKKIIITLSITLLGAIIYFGSSFFIFFINGLEFPMIFFLIHLLLSITYINKKYSKKYLLMMCGLAVIYLIIIILLSSVCDEYSDAWNTDVRVGRCDCFGAKRYVLFGPTRCIGIRTNCYERFIFYKLINKDMEREEVISRIYGKDWNGKIILDTTDPIIQANPYKIGVSCDYFDKNIAGYQSSDSRGAFSTGLQ